MPLESAGGVTMGKLKAFTDKVWYGIGAVGLDLSYGMFNGRLSKYMTNVLKLSPTFLLGLTAAARIWDGVNDPMMGSIVDNTSTKFGKYRPWVVAGSLMNAVVLFFLFFNPGFSAGSLPLYFYAAVLYVLWGMTNTAADIPYWSMVPSFTTDPKERSILATIARAFSGFGQGVVLIGSPILLNALGTLKEDGNYEWTQKGYTLTAVACAVGLLLFSVISMSRVKETVVTKPKEKFSFRKIFDVFKQNDQLRVFILFALLSNAGFYTTSGAQDYFFEAVAGNTKQAAFSLFGTVGSVLGLAFIPIMMKFTSRRRTYQLSLIIALLGYGGMALSGNVLGSDIGLNLSFLIASVGTASMFVSQTVFLADIVDYGEVKMGDRNESVTFAMKGFLQKMAYTIQTVILFASLALSGFGDFAAGAGSGVVYAAPVKTAIKLVFYAVPPLFILLSLIVFTTRFKLHGKYMEEITEKVTAARERRIAEAEAEKAGKNAEA